MRKAVVVGLMVLMVAVPAMQVAAGGTRAPLPAVPLPLSIPGVPQDVMALAHKPAQWQDFMAVNERNLLGQALPDAAVPAPLLPSVGLARIVAESGPEASAKLDPAVLRAYDAMPKDARDALGSLLAAYLDMERLTIDGFLGLSVADLDAYLKDPTKPMPQAFDWAMMFQGQREMLAASQAAVPVFQADLPALQALPPVSVCLAVNVDFTPTDNVYDCDFKLSIDGQGNDLYLNNAGGSGSQLVPAHTGNDIADHFAVTGAGYALDLSGNDRYMSGNPAYNSNREQGGIAGGAFVGEGMLIEVAGDDQYHPAVNSSGDFQGGSEEGSGVLLELGGNDNYNGDLGLHRKFHSSGGGINGGTVAGAGLMVDYAGDDVYDGWIDGAGGVNGALHGGSATLIDYAGNDRYNGFALDYAGVNGAGIGGHGLLLDVSGDDSYNGTIQTIGGVNGGAYLGANRLVDLAGDDRYDGTVSIGGVNGGAFDPYSVGSLIDAGGNDHYTGQVTAAGGVNGAGMFAQASLLDLGGGDDTYETRNDPTNPVAMSNGAAFLSDGLLLDDGGHDAYRDHQSDAWRWDFSCAPKGSAAGAEIDLPNMPGSC